VWPTPLQALLVAERCAALSGCDTDFVMIVTIAYTGMRWGETIGLERDHVHDDEIHVEWQLREIRSTFHRLPPKDDSYRSPNWEPCLPVDLPPFLAALLARQIKEHPRPRCACAAQHGGSGQYVFLGPDGGHPRRSNYARRVFRPACDGRYQPQPSKPPRLTIVDASAWPGIPITTWASTASATRCPACAASTPTLPTGCAKTSRPPFRPAGKTRSANGPPSTNAHPSRSSTRSSRPFAPKNRTQRHHETPSRTTGHQEAGRR